jgi:hypothetical protein
MTRWPQCGCKPLAYAAGGSSTAVHTCQERRDIPLDRQEWEAYLQQKNELAYAKKRHPSARRTASLLRLGSIPDAWQEIDDDGGELDG